MMLRLVCLLVLCLGTPALTHAQIIPGGSGSGGGGTTLPSDGTTGAVLIKTATEQAWSEDVTVVDGHLGVGTTTPNYGNYTRAISVLGVSSWVEMVSNRADGAGVTIGGFEANWQTAQSGHQQIARFLMSADGSTANQRGGVVIFQTKADASTTLTERMRITQGGNVQVANLAGSGNRAVYSDASGNLTNSSSDARLKTNVETITAGLALVERLRGVRFDWVDTARRGAQREIGMLAQEVAPVVPEVVGTNADGTLSVDYPKLTALLIEAVKDLSQRVQQLERDRIGSSRRTLMVGAR